MLYNNNSSSNISFNTPKRQKRGAFDFGGIFLSSLFGLATEGNLKLVSNKVDVIAHAIEASNLAMVQLQHNQFHVSIQINQLKKQLYKYGQTVEVFEHLQWIIDRNILFKFQLTTMEKFLDYLLNLDNEINTLLVGAQGNSLHILPKVLFPFEMFEKINAATEEKLNMKSITPLTRKNFPHYLNAVRVFPGSTLTSMILIIPYTPDKAFSTYKFHSFPTFHKKLSQYRVSLNLKLPYMLLSNDLKTITNLDESDFKLCTHVFMPDSRFLCYLSHAMYSYPLGKTVDLNIPRCQEAIIRMNSTQDCEFTPFTSNATIIKRVGKRIYLSSVEPLQAVVNCPTGNVQPVLKKLTILSEGCSFSSRGVSLLNFREVRGDTLVEIPSRAIPEFNAIDYSENFPKEKTDFDPVITLTDHDGLIKEKIQESQDLLKEARKMPAYVPYVSTGLSLTTLLIVGIIVAALCFQRRLLYTEESNNTSRNPLIRMYANSRRREATLPTGHVRGIQMSLRKATSPSHYDSPINHESGRIDNSDLEANRSVMEPLSNLSPIPEERHIFDPPLR